MNERADTMNGLVEWAIKLGSIVGVGSLIAGVAGYVEFKYMFERMGASWLIGTVPADHFVRKGAAVFIYILIGLFISWGLNRTSLERDFLRRWLALVVGLVVSIAATFALFLLFDLSSKYSPLVSVLGQFFGFLLGVSVGCYIYDLVFNAGLRGVGLAQLLQLALSVVLVTYTAPNISGRSKGYEISTGSLEGLPVVYVKGEPKYRLIEAIGDSLIVFETLNLAPRKVSVVKFGEDISVGLKN